MLYDPGQTRDITRNTNRIHNGQDYFPHIIPQKVHLKAGIEVAMMIS
jgi:hypothetical protein